MSFITRKGRVFIGRRELQNHGHYTWYAIGVDAEHKEAWLKNQRRRFPDTDIICEQEWFHNGTILAYYEGPPPGRALDVGER